MLTISDHSSTKPSKDASAYKSAKARCNENKQRVVTSKIIIQSWKDRCESFPSMSGDVKNPQNKSFSFVQAQRHRGYV